MVSEVRAPWRLSSYSYRRVKDFICNHSKLCFGPPWNERGFSFFSSTLLLLSHWLLHHLVKFTICVEAGSALYTWMLKLRGFHPLWLFSQSVLLKLTSFVLLPLWRRSMNCQFSSSFTDTSPCPLTIEMNHWQATGCQSLTISVWLNSVWATRRGEVTMTHVHSGLCGRMVKTLVADKWFHSGMFAANIQPIASSYLTQFHLLAAEAWHVQQECIKQRGINLWGLEKSFSNEISLFYVKKKKKNAENKSHVRTTASLKPGIYLRAGNKLNITKEGAINWDISD